MNNDIFQDQDNSTTSTEAEKQTGLATKALGMGKKAIKTIAPIALAGTLGGLVGEAFRRR